MLLGLARTSGSTRTAGVGGAVLGPRGFVQLDSPMVVAVAGSVVAWGAPRCEDEAGAVQPRQAGYGNEAAGPRSAGVTSACVRWISDAIQQTAYWTHVEGRGAVKCSSRSRRRPRGPALMARVPRAPRERGRATGAARGARRGAIGGALLCWVVYSFAMRWGSDQTFTGRALIELAWYITPLALLLTVVGIAWATWSEPWERWLPWILLAAAALFVFSWRTLIDPFHPWARGVAGTGLPGRHLLRLLRLRSSVESGPR